MLKQPSLLALLLAVTLTSASVAAWNYHRMAVRVAELEHTQRGWSNLSAEWVRRHEFERELYQLRMESLKRLEEIAHEDSPDGEWLRMPVPDRVREAWAAPGDHAVPDPVRD